MGTIHHHAIIATTCFEEEADRMLIWMHDRQAHAQDDIPNPNNSGHFGVQFYAGINGYQSICLFPDGSKEGWTDSDNGDELRTEFLAALKESDYEDGSNPWSWVEVSFGEKEPTYRSNAYHCDHRVVERGQS